MRLKQNILVTLLLVVTAGCATSETVYWNSSTTSLLEFGEMITPELLRSHLEFIAHDSLKGRDTGSDGLRMAAGYLAGYYSDFGFTAIGDSDTYFQHFELTVNRPDSIHYSLFTISEGDTTITFESLEAAKRASSFFSLISGTLPVSAPVYVAGFETFLNSEGVRPSEPFSKVESGAWLLIFEELPDGIGDDMERDLNRRIRSLYEQFEPAGILLIPDLTAEEYEQFMGVNPRFNSNSSRPRLTYLSEESRQGTPSQNILYIHPSLASELLELESESELHTYNVELAAGDNSIRQLNHHLSYTPYFTDRITTENVVAFLQGSDPELQDEVVILMAHYDHIGYETDPHGELIIYNGADDNGSGTAALIAAAEAIHLASEAGFRPRRSILFLHVSAEEIGLLGSRFYSDHPLIPIEQTVAAFNADMIGRSDPRNLESGDTDYVYLIGGDIISSGLDSTVVRANEMSVNMRLDRYYNDLRDRNQFFRRSDHWNLGRLEVPFVFFFTGVHEDYHRPTDTADKIDYEKLARITRLIYSSVIKTANLETRPIVDNEEFIEITRRLTR